MLPSTDVECTRIVNATSHLDDEGLADMNIQDVEELFQEQTLSEEELMKFISMLISNASIDNNFENMNDESNLI